MHSDDNLTTERPTFVTHLECAYTGERHAADEVHNLSRAGKPLLVRYDLGGVAKALRGCPVPVVVGGITSDRLYPLRLQEELAELLPGCTELHVVDSIYGHDGFLVESEAVGDLVRKTLELADNEGACRR